MYTYSVHTLYTFKVLSDLAQRITMFQAKGKQPGSYLGQLRQNNVRPGEHVRVER